MDKTTHIELYLLGYVDGVADSDSYALIIDAELRASYGLGFEAGRKAYSAVQEEVYK